MRMTRDLYPFKRKSRSQPECILSAGNEGLDLYTSSSVQYTNPHFTKTYRRSLEVRHQISALELEI